MDINIARESGGGTRFAITFRLKLNFGFFDSVGKYSVCLPATEHGNRETNDFSIEWFFTKRMSFNYNLLAFLNPYLLKRYFFN